MLFVGVIGENKDYRLLNKRIKKEISKFKEKLELIDIDDKSIDNLKNVKFDTIVILSFPNKLNNKVYEITGIDIKKITFEGPEEELNLTKNTQLAILTMELGILEVLKEKGMQ